MNIVKPLILLGVGVTTSLIGNDAYRTMAGEKFEPVKPRTFKELVYEEASELKIPHVVVDAIWRQESGGKDTMMVAKFEPHHLKRYGYKISNNEEIARAYSTSWCPLQVMGWHLKFSPDGKRWNRGEFYDLMKPEKCAEEGLRVLNDCRVKNTQHNKTDWEKTAECYNGSAVYAKNFKQRVMSELFNNL